ncbi:MAG: PorP/SprF family type IX secretion system membrane protein [Sphingobacteriaceae bacterium]|nr:PorP/SprF family type IX secretion system membrane protein [Sphingobacteriaceae bacterium]
MKRIIFLLLIITSAQSGRAQLTPSKSQYFVNQFLINPAMAGKDDKTNIFINYSGQWNKIEGAPVLMSLSANSALSEQAAVGLNVFSDKAGLLQRSQVMGSFAYKVPFDDEHCLKFGLSLTWAREQLNLGDATSSGSPDIALSNYNDKRKGFLDGNFGVAYLNTGLEVQFSYQNLNQKRSKQFSTVDYSVFYSALAYEFNREQSFTIKPLLAYRGVKGYKNQWDVASEFSFDKMINLYAMYHSNQSFSGGAGYILGESLNASVMYNSEPVKVRGLTGGIIDVMLGYSF